MRDIKTLGLDIAKNIFQLHGINQEGKQVLIKRLKRDSLVEFISQLPKCTIGIESCGSSNYWARQFRLLGHEVKLIAPQFVKPYVRGNKTDANDARAICEAITRPDARFVPIKELEHQDVQMLHRIRSQKIKERTALSNQIRGLLAEYGIIFAKGINAVRSKLWDHIEDATNELTAIAREEFSAMYDDFCRLDERIKKIDIKISTIAKQNKQCKKLMDREGVGPVIATIFWATITQPHLFKNGRGVSAYLGTVPKQHSSGDKTRLLGISKRGNPYVRMQIIHGARSVIYSVQKKDSTKLNKQERWIKDKVDRCGANKAAVAYANKTMRVLWALLANKEEYKVAA